MTCTKAGGAELTAGELSAPDRVTEAARIAHAHRERAAVLLGLGRALYLQDNLEAAAATFDRALAEPGLDDEAPAKLRAGWLSVARLLPSLRAEAQARTAPLID